MTEANITLRPMTEADIPFGLELRAAAGWNQTEEDWRTFLSLQPGGGFVASWRGTPAGSVVAVEYDATLGWVAMLLVHPDTRRRGLGTALLDHALGSLAHCETVKLDATPAGKTVYDQRGFVDEYRFARMLHTGHPTVGPEEREPDADLRDVTEAAMETWIAFDGDVFGRPRGAVLHALRARAPRYAIAIEGPGDRKGLCLGRRGFRTDQIGPILATDETTARTLLRAALSRTGGGPVIVDAFLRHADWIRFLEELGFTAQRELTRMFRGPNRHPGRPELHWAASGPELG